MIDLKVNPYFDDYDPEKGFYRILFKPGFAVQVRELNQLQSIIQNQIGTQGNHLFKGGSLVIPGNLSIDLEVEYVKLISENSSLLNSEIIGKKIKGKTTGIIATIIFYSQSEDSDLPTLFVRYDNSGNLNQKTFSAQEAIAYYDDPINSTIFTVSASNTSPLGNSSIATIDDGYYFIQNTFVKVNRQIIVLEKYNNSPSFRIGLLVEERDVTSNEDPSLLDNASGSYNFSAPGANRLLIRPVLVKIGIEENLDKFILLAIVREGKVENVINQTEYSVLETNLARRTFDESGDYTVRPFRFKVSEFRNNNRGTWSSNTPYLGGDIVLNNGRYYTAIRDIPQTTGSIAPIHLIGIDGAKNWRAEPNPLFNQGVNPVSLGETIETQRDNESKLVVSVEPGKAYVKGFEIEKVVTENVVIQKARDIKQNERSSIDTTVGNFILVSSVRGLPTTQTNNFPTIDLHDIFIESENEANSSVSKIGTAKVRYFERSSLLSGTCPNFFLSIFDIRMNEGKSFNRDTKAFTSTESGTFIAKSFIANIFPTRIPLTGIITVTNNTVEGAGTLFQSELKDGDYIEFTSATCPSISSYLRRVESITPNSNTNLTLFETNEEFAEDATNSLFFRIETRIRESNLESLLYRLPYPYVKSVNNNLLEFTYLKFFQTGVIASGQGGSGGIGITVNCGANETFQPSSNTTNFLLLNSDTKAITPNVNFTTSSDLKSVSIQGEGLVAGDSYILSASIKTSGSIRTKTLISHKETITSEEIYQKQTIVLKNSDGFKLNSVLMKANQEATTYTIDITDRYLFNDGQKITHYDFASISLKQNQIAPEFPIEIYYEYFNPGSSGFGPFTVNSYSGISFSDIPKFNGISLSQFIDFRPIIQSSSGTEIYKESAIPKRGYPVELEFDYYLGRIDKVVLSKTGSFFSAKGVSGIYPKEPNDPSEGMVLSKIKLFPYTYKTDSLEMEIIDNKRYTMRDIGRLEKRIDNVEYYTSLSLLEQNTKSFEIKDEFGLNRFKNGFIVDGFSGHNIGDVTSVDYQCSIDMEKGELRPSFYSETIPLVENIDVQANGNRDGYTVTGDLITLPYTEVEFISQESSNIISEEINPFTFSPYIGKGNLIPSSDDWFDNKTTPDLISNPNGNFNTIRKELNFKEPLGTIWNSWQTYWFGVPVQSTFEQDQQINEDLGLSNKTTMDVSLTNILNLRPSLVPITKKDVFENKIISDTIIPFIRPRSLLFTLSGLKPNTEFNPLFDGIDVSAFIRKEVIVKIEKGQADYQFNTTSRSGISSGERGRITPNGNSLDVGDIVFVKQRDENTFDQNSSPTCSLLSYVTVDEEFYYLHLVNLTGQVGEGINSGKNLFLTQNDYSSAFQAGDIIETSLSGIEVKIDEVTTNNTIKTDSFGNITGIFDIPNNESIRFRSGIREFKLVEIGSGRSFGRIQYRSQGILETIQESIISTRPSSSRQEAIINNQIITSSRRTSSQTGWVDPLAQTFLVDSPGGVFLTSISIFMKKKDEQLPLHLEIRNVINGYPGPSIIPFSSVNLFPSDIQVSEDSSIETEVHFPSPVYLEDNREYSIILSTDSSEHEIYISSFENPGNKKPFIGSLFKSQNSSIWLPNNIQSLKFKLNKAKFTTNSFGTIEFIPPGIQDVLLDHNPFYMRKNNRYIRVIHRNHGMDVGDTVSISTLSNSIDPINNVGRLFLFKNHTIQHVDVDSYVIQLENESELPELSGYFGGREIYSSRQIKFNYLQPNIQQLIFENTDLSYQINIPTSNTFTSILENNLNRFIDSLYSIKTNSLPILKSLIKSSNENISPVIDLGRLSLTAIKNRINLPIENQINYDPIDKITLFEPIEIPTFEANFRVLVDDSEGTFTFIGQIPFSLQNNSIIVISGFTGGFENNNGTYTITSINEDEVEGEIYTIIAIDKGSKELVDVTEEDTVTVTITLDQSYIIQISDFKIDVDGDDKTFTISGDSFFSQITPGKFIEVSNFSNSINNGKYLVKKIEFEEDEEELKTILYVETSKTLITETESDKNTLNLLNYFVDEIAPIGGSSLCKYVTKKINLKNPSTSIKIRFSASIEKVSDIKVYYKTEDVGTRITFESKNYDLLEPENRIIKSDDGQFSEVEYFASDLDQFDAVQVKIVLQSANESDISRIKNLSIICFA